MRRILITLLSITLVLGAVLIARSLVMNAPQAERKRPPKTAALVKTRTLGAADETITLKLTGTVVPAEAIKLQARVAGEVVSMAPNFIDGGRLKKGEAVLRIDPVDYELALADAESKLEQARFAYKTELGRQEVAKHEWELFKTDDATELEQELALRKPHLAADKAALNAAEAALRKAQINLERTHIRAPFNAIVTKRSVHIGSQAALQTELGALVGTDAYWVKISIPVDRLRRVSIPGASVKIVSASGATRQGTVIKLLGDLEEKGRMARLLVEVKDPQGALPQNRGKNPLLLGEYIRAEIEGSRLAAVHRIPRLAFRENSTVWIAKDGKLDIRPVEVLWRDTDQVIIGEGIDDGESLILSDLTAPIQAMDVADGRNAPEKAKQKPANEE